MIDIKDIKVGDEVWHGNLSLSRSKLSFTDFRDLKLFKVVAIGTDCFRHATTIFLEEIKSGQDHKKPETRTIRVFSYRICATVLESDGEKAKDLWNKIVDHFTTEIKTEIDKLNKIAYTMETRLRKLKK